LLVAAGTSARIALQLGAGDQRLARLRADVELVLIAVVAGLDARLHHAVPAPRVLAARAAPVGLDDVGVVALLDLGLHEAVAAARQLAARQARVGVVVIAVVSDVARKPG
jgi:hypothetical protein